MDAIPEDALIEILRRVPKKSRYRCKSVSKEWLKLISAKTSSLYSSSSTTTTTWGLAFKQLDGSMTFCRLDEHGRLTVDESVDDFSYAKDCRSPYTIGSCNGLLYSCGSVGPELGFKIMYFVDNPVTKQSLMLPELPILEDKLYLRPAGLGFTFDDTDASNWKLVALLQDPNPRPSSKLSRGLTVSVFDSRRWAWKKTRPARFTDDSDPSALDSIPCCTFRLGASSVHIDGALHWVWNSRLVLFYLETWSFRIIKLPDVVNQQNEGLLWRSEGGRLNYCHVCSKQGLCIWVLEKDDQTAEDHVYSWHKIYSVSMDDLMRSMLSIEPVSSFCQMICPYAVNEELQLIHLNVNESLACFDIAEKTVLHVSNIPSECKALVKFPVLNRFIGWKFMEPAGRQPRLTKLGVTKTIVKPRRSSQRVKSLRR